MAEWRICVVFLLFVGYCLLQVCGAGNVTCTVTPGTDQTTYSVPDEGASGCSYSWANASDTGHSVLAHQEGLRKDGPVRSANVSTLITSEYFPRVIYTRDCLSEEEEHTSVVCRKRSCLRKIMLLKLRKPHPRIIPVIIISFVIVLVGLIYFRTKRTCFNSTVNMKGVEAQAPVGQ